MYNNDISPVNFTDNLFDTQLNEIKNLPTEATNKIHELLPRILNYKESTSVDIKKEISEVKVSNNEKDVLVKLLFLFKNIRDEYTKDTLKKIFCEMPLEEQDTLLSIIWPFINEYAKGVNFSTLIELMKKIPRDERVEVSKSLFPIFMTLKQNGCDHQLVEKFAINYIEIDSSQRSQFEKTLLPLILDPKNKDFTSDGWLGVLNTLKGISVENRLDLLKAYGPILQSKVFDRKLRVVFSYLSQIPPSKYDELYQLSSSQLLEFEKNPMKDVYKLRLMVLMSTCPENQRQEEAPFMAKVIVMLPGDPRRFDELKSLILQLPTKDHVQTVKTLSNIVDRFKSEKNFSEDFKDFVNSLRFTKSPEVLVEILKALTPELKNLNSFNHLRSCFLTCADLDQEDVTPALKSLVVFCKNFPCEEFFRLPCESSSSFLKAINFLNSKHSMINSHHFLTIVSMLGLLQLHPSSDLEKIYSPLLDIILSSKENISQLRSLLINTSSKDHDKVLAILPEVVSSLKPKDVPFFIDAMSYLSPNDYENAIRDYLHIIEGLEIVAKDEYEFELNSVEDVLFILFDNSHVLLESTQKYLYEQLENLPSREAAKNISNFIIKNFLQLELADESPLLYKALAIRTTLDDVASPKDPYLLYNSLKAKMQELTPVIEPPYEEINVMPVVAKEPHREDKGAQVIVEKIPVQELLENINKQKSKETIDSELSRLSELFKQYTLEDQVPALLSAILEARKEMANTPVTFLNQLPIMDKFKGEQKKYNIIMNAIENIPENEQILLAGTETDIENLLYKLVKDDKTSQRDLLEKMMSTEVLTVSDKDKFYKFLMRVDRQAITKFPYSNDPELLKYMAYKLVQQKCPESIERAANLRLMHKELIREVNHYLVESECDFQIDGSKVKMIADFNTLGLVSLKSILRSEIETAYQALKDDEDQASIDTANLRLNPKTFQERLHEPHFYARQLPKDVNPKTLGDLFDQLEERLQSLGAADQEKIEQEISEASGELSLSQLKENLTNDPNVNTYYVDSEQSDQEISLNTLRFYAAIKFVVDQNNDVISKNSLTVRESMLLKMSTSIQACSAGKSEGLALYYNILPQQYKIQEESEVSSVSGSTNDIPEVVRGKRYLDGVIQSTLDNFMADNVSFMNELINQNNDAEIPQGAHQTIYVKNLISARVGHYHPLKFDPYSKLINDHLFNLSLEDVLRTYYKHFKPSLLIEELKNTIKRDIGKEATLYNDLSRTIAESGRSYREDLVWKISEEEGEQPFELTTYGAMQILITAGFISEES